MHYFALKPFKMLVKTNGKPVDKVFKAGEFFELDNAALEEKVVAKGIARKVANENCSKCDLFDTDKDSCSWEKYCLGPYAFDEAKGIRTLRKDYLNPEKLVSREVALSDRMVGMHRVIISPKEAIREMKVA